MLKKWLALSLAGLSLTGCAGLTRLPVPAELPVTAQQARAKAVEQWGEPPIVREGRPMAVLFTPYGLPDTVARMPVKAALEPNATVQDLAAVLGKLGVSILIADKDAAQVPFYLPHFNGRLGPMLNAVSKAADVWFTYQNGVIIVSSKERIGLSLPQDEALAKKVGEGLSAMGIGGALNSNEAGMVAMDLRPSQFLRAQHFLQRMTQNAALVTLQVAIVTVDMSQSDAEGIDWSKLQFALGKNGNTIFDPNGGAAPITGGLAQTTTQTAANTTTATVSTPSLPAYLNTFTLGGNTARLALTNSVFSLAGFVNFLGGYGNTETLQNVMLKTTTGNKVELKSITQIPYVSGVGVTTTGSSNASGQSNLLGSATTSTANDGIILKLSPAFDSEGNTVTLNLDLAIDTVVSFNSVQAGNQIGSFSQPTTTTRSFNDILRLRPGETVVVGGVSYESVAKNFAGPVGLRGSKYESQTLQTKKQTMFIVIRPTVRTFGALSSRPGEDANGGDGLPKEGAGLKRTDDLLPVRKAKEGGDAVH